MNTGMNCGINVMRSIHRKTGKTMIDYLTYLFAFGVGVLGGKGGPRVRELLSRVVARVLIISSRSRWQTTRENIRRVYPESSGEWIENIATSSYLNFATCYVELFATRFMTQKERTSLFILPDDNEIIRNSKSGRGAIVISAHIGNWELAVPVTAEVLCITAVSIAKKQRNKSINEFINRCRSSDRVRVVPMDEAAREIVMSLRNAGFVCMMLDQAADPTKDVFVDFLGLPAVTFEAPATLALRFKADILAAFAIRQSDGRYHVYTERIDTSGIEDSVEGRTQLVQCCTDVIARYVRRYPEQWSWQHKRWKYNPADFSTGGHYESYTTRT